MRKNISNEALREHLAECMERLLDPELVDTPEKAQTEINKAKSMQELVSAAIEISQVEIEEKKTVIEAMKVAGQWNYDLNKIPALGIEETKPEKKY